MPRLMIVACEASGDVQAAAVVRQIHQVEPDVEVLAVGGVRLRAEKVRMLYDSSNWGTVGVWEAFPRAPGIFLAFQQIKRAIRDEAPDLLVVVDSPAINLPLVRYARRCGVRNLYYFPPSQWTENLERYRDIAARTDKVIVAFQFTARKYEEAGVPAAYFGHPLLDLLQDTPDRAEARKIIGLEGVDPIVGLLPGSRPQEVSSLLPPLLEAARMLTRQVPGVRFAIPVATPLLRSRIEAGVQECGLPIVLMDGHARTVMAASDVLLMASGTASLEAAILGTPMVIIYKLPAFDWTLGHLRGLKVRWMGLPNLVLQRSAVTELLQHDVTPERLTQEALDLLVNPQKRAAMKESLLEAKKSLGNPGVVSAVAQFILENMALGRTRSGNHHQ